MATGQVASAGMMVLSTSNAGPKVCFHRWGSSSPRRCAGWSRMRTRTSARVDFGVHVVSFAYRGERVEHHEAPAGLLRAEEDRVFPGKSDDPERSVLGV